MTLESVQATGALVEEDSVRRESLGFPVLLSFVFCVSSRIRTLEALRYPRQTLFDLIQRLQEGLPSSH